MSREAEKVAAKFVQGKPGNSPRATIGTHVTPSNYGSRVLNDGKRIYSYGRHYLIAERDNERGGFWINEEPYETGDYWKNGNPKISVTTRSHVSAVRSAVLGVADATDIVETRLSDPDYPNHFYRYRFYRYFAKTA